MLWLHCAAWQVDITVTPGTTQLVAENFSGKTNFECNVTVPPDSPPGTRAVWAINFREILTDGEALQWKQFGIFIGTVEHPTRINISLDVEAWQVLHRATCINIRCGIYFPGPSPMTILSSSLIVIPKGSNTREFYRCAFYLEKTICQYHSACMWNKGIPLQCMYFKGFFLPPFNN